MLWGGGGGGRGRDREGGRKGEREREREKGGGGRGGVYDKHNISSIIIIVIKVMQYFLDEVNILYFS